MKSLPILRFLRQGLNAIQHKCLYSSTVTFKERAVDVRIGRRFLNLPLAHCTLVKKLVPTASNISPR